MQGLAIEGDGYRIECDPIKGGVLRSLTWRGCDVLRPCAEACDDPLETAMFPLVPFSNRLSEDVTINGGKVRLPRYLSGCDLAIHGFGWQKEWQVEDHSDRMLRIALEDADSPWPSSYRAEQQLTINGQGFHTTLTITNLGTQALPAGIGFHPYFPRADCLMTIGLDTMWQQDELGLPLQQADSGWDPLSHIPMKHRRLDHSFSGWNGVAQMRWPERNLAVELVADTVLRELVIYSPDDDYFCLEPVSHLTNAMFAKDAEKRRGWRVLDPGQSLTGTMSLRARRIA